jgi:hypothetical protein
MTIVETRRFLEKLLIGDGCWEWQASLQHGYGQMGVSRRPALAHRLSYELFRGPIPAGMQIDHLCRNRKCQNPDHFDLVDMQENIRRSPLSNVNKTHCKHNHEYTPENTYIRPYGGRDCKACQRERHKAVA